jgi:hypothetical protein
VLPLGRRDRTLIQQLHRTDSSTPRLRRPGRRADTAAGTRDHAMGNTRLRVPRSFLDPRTAGSRNRAMGYQKNPRISDWQRRHRARRPALLRQPATPSPRPVHGETSACPLDKRAAISAYVPVPLLPEGRTPRTAARTTTPPSRAGSQGGADRTPAPGRDQPARSTPGDPRPRSDQGTAPIAGAPPRSDIPPLASLGQ